MPSPTCYATKMRGGVSQFRRFYAILGSAIYLQQSRCGRRAYTSGHLRGLLSNRIVARFDPPPHLHQNCGAVHSHCLRGYLMRRPTSGRRIETSMIKGARMLASAARPGLFARLRKYLTRPSPFQNSTFIGEV